MARMNRKAEKNKALAPLTPGLCAAAAGLPLAALAGFMALPGWETYAPGESWLPGLFICFGLLGPVLGVFAIMNCLLVNRRFRGSGLAWLSFFAGLAIFLATPYCLAAESGRSCAVFPEPREEEEIVDTGPGR